MKYFENKGKWVSIKDPNDIEEAWEKTFEVWEILVNSNDDVVNVFEGREYVNYWICKYFRNYDTYYDTFDKCLNCPIYQYGVEQSEDYYDCYNSEMIKWRSYQSSKSAEAEFIFLRKVWEWKKTHKDYNKILDKHKYRLPLF